MPLHAASWREAATADGGDVRDEASEPPPDAALRGEMRRILERRIDDLPVAFRTVFVMREVEDMSVGDRRGARHPVRHVRTRLFRARALLREALARDLDIATPDVFGFAGARCDRIVRRRARRDCGRRRITRRRRLTRRRRTPAQLAPGTSDRPCASYLTWKAEPDVTRCSQ